jgi:hypothetical protein
MRALLMVVVMAAGPSAAFAGGMGDLGDFWQRGAVRELLVRGIDNVSLEEWADIGVNCVMNVPPEEAHALGLRTRRWFTMNLLNPASFDNDMDAVLSMTAVTLDGTHLRPHDPLFPTVANYWSACVNNPRWREFSAGLFRSWAEQGWDGCHIDYAARYEPCFCEHCRSLWGDYAAERALHPDLATLPGDVRTQMHLRQFRIEAVMDFLAMCRDEAQAIRPGFATDGTWHQDPGSAYQWAYGPLRAGGAHFDMMCIEGTTWGPFPPRSQQILWLKLAHALTVNQIAMSVTYHLITEDGKRRHGRMARDRAEVALAEIMSQGAVSWLGLGGPETGNLLREHSEMVRGIYRLWAELEPQLTSREEIGQVGIVFSPRSYLRPSNARNQLYVVGQALMRSHIPFVIHSDVGLSADRLATCPATVVLDAEALSDDAMAAIAAYHADGGKVLFLGAMPALDEDWAPREQVAELFRHPGGEGGEGVVTRMVGGRPTWYLAGDLMAPRSFGAMQSVHVDQQEAAPLAIEGESRALEIDGEPGHDYSLYVDITYQDGTHLWGQVATFDTGSHDWQFARAVIEPEKPVLRANVHLLLRNRTGTAWFRRVSFGPWDAQREQITQNMLSDGLDPEGVGAQPAWRPYAAGFEVEEIAGEGPTIKAAGAAGAGRVTQMHHPDIESQQAALALLSPILPERSMLRLEGEGAGQVYCDVALTDGGALLQLINYNASLHPELPELEQQQADRAIPVQNLRIRFEPPGGARVEAVTLMLPGEEPRALPVEGGEVTVPVLRTYAALLLELAQ